MIPYVRTSWFGASYLIQLKGSLLPRCLGPATVAGTIAGLVASGSLDKIAKQEFKTWFGHPLSVQLIGIVLGYLCIARLNMCYSRYWEGVTHVKMMHSKWADACSQIIAFDQCDKPICDLSSEPFCRHIVHLFSSMSAMAVLQLHVVDSSSTHLGRTAPVKQLPKLTGLIADEIAFYEEQVS